MHPVAEETPADRVGYPRHHATQRGIVPVGAPPAGKVTAARLHQRQQRRDVARVVLPVAIHRDDEVPYGGLQSGQERERLPGQPRLASIIGTRNVAIALSAGTLCHCIVFVPNLFGETNNISIFMAQIAITISVSLLASWLVAVSLIPMLSARMATPKLVHSQTGMIARLQRRYATLLDWSLHHRGWSLLGIVLVVLTQVLAIALAAILTGVVATAYTAQVERREILRQQRHAALIGARGRLQRRQGTTMRAQKGGIILRRIEREVREEGVYPLMTRHGRFAQGLTSAAGIRGFRHSAVLKGMTGEFFDLN